jgi:hypothetical protein
MAEASAASNQIIRSLTENITVADAESIKANFIASVIENSNLTDVKCYIGWFKINEDQVAAWTAITTPTGTWTNINDAQTPNWNDIDAKQPCS